MKSLIIAEAGVNHNGSLELAKKLIDVAAQAGADIVKFQTFQAKKLVNQDAAKAAYQIKATGSRESQFQMLKRLELSASDHFELRDHCEKSHIEFLSTPFDAESLQFLVQEVGIKRIKIPSGEITNAPFLLDIAKTGLPTILSTGMATLADVEQALGVLAFGYFSLGNELPTFASFKKYLYAKDTLSKLQSLVTVLHCTTEYPAPIAEINLRAIETIRQAFHLPTGYSDHSAGILVPIAAAAREAVIIEKHFTLDRNMEGPDHKASLEPNELKEMILSIRAVEESLGNPLKGPTASEWGNLLVARKSLVASKDIAKGDIFDDSNLVAKRPGNGISPFRYWDLLGKTALRSYGVDELIDQ